MKETIVSIYLGDNDDDFIDCCQFSLSVIPRIGDEVEFWTTRDDKGNYKYDQSKRQFSGIVKRIEHIIQEGGKDSKSWNITHFINIFLEHKCI